MKISELRIGQDKVEVEGDVIEISETRNFNKFGRDIRVATAVLQDESGKIKTSLWNQDIDKVKIGDKIKVSNGFVKEFQGEKQLTAGRYGRIEIIGKAEVASQEKNKEKQEKVEEEEKAEEIVEEVKEEELEGEEEF